MTRFGLVLVLALSVMLAIPTLALTARASGNSQLSYGRLDQTSRVNVRDLPTVHDSLQGLTRTITSLAPIVKTVGSSVAPGSSVRSLSSTVTTAQVLDGVFGGAPNQCGCTPPDPNAAVGPKHVFEVTNIAGIIYHKDGTLARSTFSLADFFGVPVSSLIGDPEVMFDAASNRWFVSSIVAPNNVMFAVSTGTDPTGTFVLYKVLGGAIFPDQPFIGTSDDKLVISVNAFGHGGFAGALFWIFNKAELVRGATTVDFVTQGPDPSFASVHPARHQGSSVGIFYLVTVFIGTSNAATLLAVTGVPPSPVAVAVNSFAINTVHIPPSADQAGTGTKLETNDDRVLSATWESNVLWFSLTDACQPSGDSKTRSCARLIEIATSGTGSPTKLEDFDYGVQDNYVYYPAVSLSQGTLVVVYGQSSSTTDPSLLVTGRLPTDPINALALSVVLRSGTASDKSTRYGDYFSAATDPSSASTFWVAGEYRVDSTFQNWSTAIGEVTIA